jgi:hypothetical protein
MVLSVAGGAAQYEAESADGDEGLLGLLASTMQSAPLMRPGDQSAG